jgi:hypothetical protein
MFEAEMCERGYSAGNFDDAQWDPTEFRCSASTRYRL